MNVEILLRQYVQSDRSFSNVKLIGVDLRGAKLIKINLIHANLSLAKLQPANLYEAILVDANLEPANMGHKPL